MGIQAKTCGSELALLEAIPQLDRIHVSKAIMICTISVPKLAIKRARIRLSHEGALQL